MSGEMVLSGDERDQEVGAMGVLGPEEWGDTTRPQRMESDHPERAHQASGPTDRAVQPQGTQAQGRPGIARLLTVGVGGGGTNAVNHMIEARVQGVEFLVMNTDAQALEMARTPNRLRLGETLTRGLGAGGNPEIGRRAAEESYTAICEALTGADMVFVTAGMGGGTGTGASPFVAQAAREVGALTVAVVTTPFAFERRRKVVAEQGLPTLREMVDALIVVPNERLMQLAGSDMSAFAAYKMADDVLRQGIQGISDLITIPGLINLDFADIKVVMTDAGTALMSIGQASGENRAEEAARKAITNPLLEVDISGARGVVFNIAGSDDLTMREVDTIAEVISGAAHADANIIFGTIYDPSLSGSLKITVVATGFEPRVAYNRQHPLRAKTPPVQPVQPVAPPHAPVSTATGPVPAMRTVQPAQPSPGGLHVGPALTARRDLLAMAPPERGKQSEFEADTTSRVAGQDALALAGDAGDVNTAPLRRPPVDMSARGDGQDRSERRRGVFRPGYHGDEFMANDEPEAAPATPVARSRWEQLFGRH
jgi:cell division protein FtsZ